MWKNTINSVHVIVNLHFYSSTKKEERKWPTLGRINMAVQPADKQKNQKKRNREKCLKSLKVCIINQSDILFLKLWICHTGQEQLRWYICYAITYLLTVSVHIMHCSVYYVILCNVSKFVIIDIWCTWWCALIREKVKTEKSML